MLRVKVIISDKATDGWFDHPILEKVPMAEPYTGAYFRIIKRGTNRIDLLLWGYEDKVMATLDFWNTYTRGVRYKKIGEGHEG